MAEHEDHTETSRRALIEVSPDLAERLRDPRFVLALVAATCGAIALLIGYWGISGTLDPGEQLPYLLSGGVGGLFLLGLAATLLFSADLSASRSELVAQREVLEDVQRNLEAVRAELAALRSASTTKATSTRNGTGPGKARERSPSRASKSS